MNWSVRPFVRLVIFYVPGILLGRNISGYQFDTIPLLIFFLILLLISFVVVKWFTSYKYRWLNGLVIYSTVFLLGVYNSYNCCSNGSALVEGKNYKVLIAEIVTDPVETKKSVKAVVETLDESTGKKFKILIYFEKTARSRNLIYGDRIALETKLKNYKNAGNPSEFDYAFFLANRNIFFTSYVRQQQWKYLGNSPSNKIFAFAKSLRDKLLIKLKTNSYFDNTFQVSAAILLGYDYLMNAETQKDFVRAGAMHILCVSGLHVGVIFMILSVLLNFMKSTLHGRLFRMILLLVSVWAYALLTGMSPSVQRAATMLSFFIVGEAFNRLKDNYNTLAASAFVMLLFNPALIFSVGFQLSYAAVLGIISIYRPVFNLLYFKNIALKYFWSVLAVSIAAQIGTFPIATHYFHYFPTYFWIVNLFVIPLSFLIIFSGFAFFIVSWIPVLSTVMGWFTSLWVLVLSTGVSYVELFPFYGVEDIYMPWIKLLIVYLVIITSFHLLFNRRPLLLKYVIFLVFILMVFNTTVKYMNLSRNEMICYNIKNHSVVEFVEANNALLVADSLFLDNETARNFILKSSHIDNGVRGVEEFEYECDQYYSSSNLFIDGCFIGFHNKRYLLLSTTDSVYCHDNFSKMHFDAVIVCGNKTIEFTKLCKSVSFDRVIVSSSVPKWKSIRLMKDCKDAGIESFNLSESGAYAEVFR